MDSNAVDSGGSSGGEMVWAHLLHLSPNMWFDREAPEWGEDYARLTARPYLQCDTGLWNQLLGNMADAGLNMVVIDLGDAVEYQSHPEIAVENAWTVDRLKRELVSMRDMGLEPIPKLNFSACHDVWLGPYSRCVSTDTYYAVCRDLIAEVIELFDRPRLFHLGMDEETAQHQRYQQYVVIRQHDLWWHDLAFLVEQVEKLGVRPWVWSDYLWHHPEEFFKRMPRSVVQSNWYYDTAFDEGIDRVKAYLDLEAHGYDQIPTGSYDKASESFGNTVAYCRQHIAPERLLGFMQTVWRPTLEKYRQRHVEAIEVAGKAAAHWNSMRQAPL